jgi:hypothetical protein
MPGSKMIPAEQALRSCLALKLWSIERHSHVMALVADEGLALFAGLNAIPKKSYLRNIVRRRSSVQFRPDTSVSLHKTSYLRFSPCRYPRLKFPTFLNICSVLCQLDGGARPVRELLM